VEVNFESRKQTLQPKPKKNETNLAFCTAIPTSSTKLEANTHEKLTFNRTTIAQENIQRTSPNIIYKRGRCLKDILVRSKL